MYKFSKLIIMNIKIMSKRFILKMLLLSFAIMLHGFVLKAQQTVTGTVTDASARESLIGATVLLKGTTTGTVTNVNGNYSLSVPNLQDTLVFSFVGYESLEVPIAGRNVINVQLRESEIMLSEMVVIGYGTVKKSDLTGSIAVVSSEELNRIPASNFTRALQGRAPGVMVSQSGSPGSGAPKSG
jgi:TonB-dependent starch-binding outer membrane protein SusC